jgi:hypothetical protein
MFAKMLRRELDRSFDSNMVLAQLAWFLRRTRLSLLLYGRTERDLSETSHAAIAASVRKFLEGVLSDRIYDEISAAAAQIPRPGKGGGPIVVTVVSTRFLDVFRIWLRQVQRNTPWHGLVIALDAETAAAVRASSGCSVLDVSAWFRFDEHGRLDRFNGNTLWILRVLTLRALVNQGWDVISLDIDAIVVGDLEAMLKSLPGSDVVAQMDYSIPMDVARRFGFILCCGFMVIRSNERTIRFLDQYCARTALEMDDQLALNHLLADAGLSNRVQTEALLSFQSSGLSWLCPAASLVSRDIGYGSVVRHFPLMDRSASVVMQSLGLPEQSAEYTQEAAAGSDSLRGS